MAEPIAYETAIDLLDADHKLAKLLFTEYTGLAEDGAPAQARKQLADKLCAEITVHAQIEEEIFYPAVRKAIGDDALMNHAQEEHDQAKKLIARIQGMKAGDAKLDECVKELQQVIMDHVTDEREKVFLKAQYSTLDLRGMVPKLVARKKELKAAGPKVQQPSHKAVAKVQKEAA